MGRPANPTPTWNPDRKIWEVRITMPKPADWPAGKEGPRKPHDLPGIRQEQPERAKVVAKIVSDRVRCGEGPPVEGESETVTQWVARWLDVRKKKGIRSTRNDKGRYMKWVAPLLGSKSVERVTRRDLEEVVQHLDRAVRKFDGKGEGLRWKTATNVWGVVTKMFSDACRSKVLALRIRDDNPARDIEGPDRGVERSGPYLFPHEFAAIMRCERVPARWKRIFMIATFLYLRGGELEALEWTDVNFEQRYVHLHQAADSETREVKPTKTNDTRKIPIEPSLLPLLVEMHRQAKGEGRVITAMPPREEWAERLRKYLKWAGVERADLFADDETRRQLSFHDLRHTGITWRAVRGDEPLKIMRAAGHDDLRTTQRYINEAQTFDPEGFGIPFPSVPLERFSDLGGFGSSFGVSAAVLAQSSHKQAVSWRPQGDSKTFIYARNHSHILQLRGRSSHRGVRKGPEGCPGVP
jgi:integrase